MLRFSLRRGRVGVLEVAGTIGGRSSISELAQTIDSVRTSRRIKALVLEIDSPGGSASASEMLYEAVKQVAARKPVVAYIRGTGASGAYYLSCAAHRIVALPTSLVGSIGVILVRPVMEQMLSKLGVGVSVYKGGHLKDMGSPWRPPTQEEDERLQGLIGEIYGNFVGVVARERGLKTEDAEKLATGEIYTGRKALELGLIDEVGTAPRAVAIAASMAGIRPRVQWVKPKRPLLERMLGRMGGSGSALYLVQEMERAMMGGIYYLSPSPAVASSRWEM